MPAALSRRWVGSSGQLIRRGQAARSLAADPLDAGYNIVLNKPSMAGFTLGPITDANLETLFGATFNDSLPANLDVVQLAGGEKVLEWFSPANTYGTATGVSEMVDLPGSVVCDKAFCEYEVWFEGATSADDFPWGWGGKLLGFGGATPEGGAPGGMDSPSGGSPNTRGWASRLMYYGPGAGYGGVINDPNELAGYPYLPDQPSGSYGVPVWTNYTIPSRQWVKLRQDYEMNTVSVEGGGDANGKHRIYANGALVYSSDTTVWRKYSNVHINEWQVSLFRGGNSASWAVPTDSYIRLRNFRVGVAQVV